MWLAIIIGVILLGVAAYGFWPRRGGVVDAGLQRSRKVTGGHAESFRNEHPQ